MPSTDYSTAVACPATTDPHAAPLAGTAVAIAGAPIAHLAEFIDSLDRLDRGFLLVQVSDGSGGWSLAGGLVHWSHETLVHFGLVESFRPPHGFRGVRYFRLSLRGKLFVRRALAQWRSLPLWRRLWLRATR